jgi:hypothetical protein
VRKLGSFAGPDPAGVRVPGQVELGVETTDQLAPRYLPAAPVAAMQILRRERKLVQTGPPLTLLADGLGVIQERLQGYQRLVPVAALGAAQGCAEEPLRGRGRCHVSERPRVDGVAQAQHVVRHIELDQLSGEADAARGERCWQLDPAHALSAPGCQQQGRG